MQESKDPLSCHAGEGMLVCRGGQRAGTRIVVFGGELLSYAACPKERRAQRPERMVLIKILKPKLS